MKQASRSLSAIAELIVSSVEHNPTGAETHFLSYHVTQIDNERLNFEVYIRSYSCCMHIHV